MRVLDRQALAESIETMVKNGRSALDILDMVIDGLTPDDDEECPICGVAP